MNIKRSFYKTTHSVYLSFIVIGLNIILTLRVSESKRKDIKVKKRKYIYSREKIFIKRKDKNEYLC